MREIERRSFLSTGLFGTGSLLAGCHKQAEASGGAAPTAGGAGEGQKASASSAPRETSSIPRRRFGATSESISILGLGGYHLGVPEESEATRLMHRAIDAGMTFFDNCWSYHQGESERRMGKALAGSKREQVFLMTKIDGRTREAAARQIDQCLRRLATDRVDLMQVHEVVRHSDAPRVFSDDGAIRALEDARRAGKVRYVGFTGHKSPDIHLGMLREAERHQFRFDAVQMPLNLADAHYESFQKEVLPRLLRDQIAVIGMKALGSGDLPRSGIVNAEECLRYALSLPATTVVTGCESQEILEQALRVGRGFSPLSDDERRELLARTRDIGREGQLERFKTTSGFDSTTRNPHWMAGAEF